MIFQLGERTTWNYKRELQGPSRAMLNKTSRSMQVAVKKKKWPAGLHCEIDVGISLIIPRESRTKRVGEKYRNMYLGLNHAF